MEIARTTDIGRGVEIIREGRVAAVPTGTAYALAVDTLQGHALQRLRNLKKRPQEKSFTVFLDPALLDEYFDITPAQREFLKQNENKPLTLLLRPRQAIAHLAGENGRVGLRIIDHPMMREVASAAAVPLTATSANVSGGAPCYSPDCIIKTFPPVQPDGSTYDLSLGIVLDAGDLPPERISTIVALAENGSVEIIRSGAWTLQE